MWDTYIFDIFCSPKNYCLHIWFLLCNIFWYRFTLSVCQRNIVKWQCFYRGKTCHQPSYRLTEVILDFDFLILAMARLWKLDNKKSQSVGNILESTVWTVKVQHLTPFALIILVHEIEMNVFHYNSSQTKNDGSDKNKSVSSLMFLFKIRCLIVHINGEVGIGRQQ